MIQNPERHALSLSLSLVSPEIQLAVKGEEGVRHPLCMSLQRKMEEGGMVVEKEEGWGGGWGVNDPDSSDRTCVSPRTTDYERATL